MIRIMIIEQPQLTPNRHPNNSKDIWKTLELIFWLIFKTYFLSFRLVSEYRLVEEGREEKMVILVKYHY